MLSILRKTRGSTARSSGSSPADRYRVADDDLTAWEIVSASQSDDEDLFSFDGDDVTSSDDDDVIAASAAASKQPEEEEEEEEEENEDAPEPRDLEALDVIMAVQSLSVSPPMTFPVEVTRVQLNDDDDDLYHDDDDDMDDDDYDVDDELVPWKLKDRFGKQRIKKLGKRGGSKPNKSKRMPYYYNKAGCV